MQYPPSRAAYVALSRPPPPAPASPRCPPRPAVREHWVDERESPVDSEGTAPPRCRRTALPQENTVLHPPLCALSCPVSSRNPTSRHARPEPCRRDGWTSARQFAFLTTLARTRCVSTAAKAATMSRESAYRLRRRHPQGLFALAWQRAMAPNRPPLSKAEVDKGHTRELTAALALRESASRQSRSMVNFVTLAKPPESKMTEGQGSERIAQQSSSSA